MFLFLAEGAVSVPAVQPYCQDWLHPWGGHTGGPVRVLEALWGAVIGHGELVLLGGQVLSAATEGSDQDGYRQEKQGASGGHNVIPVDGQGRHRNASPWWRNTEWLANGKREEWHFFVYFLHLICCFMFFFLHLLAHKQQACISFEHAQACQLQRIKQILNAINNKKRN